MYLSDEEKEVRNRNEILVLVPTPSLDCSICKNETIALSKKYGKDLRATRGREELIPI